MSQKRKKAGYILCRPSKTYCRIPGVLTKERYWALRKYRLVWGTGAYPAAAGVYRHSSTPAAGIQRYILYGKPPLTDRHWLRSPRSSYSPINEPLDAYHMSYYRAPIASRQDPCYTLALYCFQNRSSPLHGDAVNRITAGSANRIYRRTVSTLCLHRSGILLCGWKAGRLVSGSEISEITAGGNRKLKDFTRQEPLFSLCGLKCGLCTMYTGGYCPGCGGGEGNQPCPIAKCSICHGHISYCFQCGEYPCAQYDEMEPYDSFIPGRFRQKDMDRAQQLGLEAYLKELHEKMAILQRLLESYNDGRRKSFSAPPYIFWNWRISRLSCGPWKDGKVWRVFPSKRRR